MIHILDVKCFCLSFFLIVASATILRASVSESEARDLVWNNQCVKAIASDPRLIRITRNEEFEDDLFSIQIKTAKAISKDTYVFKVTPGGYFILSPENFVHVSLTGIRYVLIAVTKRNGTVFPLFGCANPKENFSALIKDVRVRIDSEADATKFALLYYAMTKDPDKERVIFKFREFRQRVEDRAFEWFSESDAEKAFRKWLERDGRWRDKVGLGLSAARKPFGFITSLTFFGAAGADNINLEREILAVDQAGEILRSQAQTLFSVSKKRNVLQTIMKNDLLKHK